MDESTTESRAWYLLFIGWMIAILSVMGSLFFSEIMKYPPCVLCWYQRICMYPLALILLAGLFPLDKKIFKYSFPFALLGWAIALYHNLLHYGIVPESASPCIQGVPCSTVYINWLGFITIPMLSFMSFTAIVILLLIFKRITNEK